MAKKLGRPTDQRMAIIKNQASELLWYGRIETTVDRAKAIGRYAEKMLTIAIKSYDDVTTATKKKVNLKGNAVNVKFENDGVKKLNARRRLMAGLVELKPVKSKDQSKSEYRNENKDINHPLIEKIFREYAPKYAKRNQEIGKGGGYTRVVKLGQRRGDAAEMAIVELV